MVLRKFGLGNVFISWICVLYTSPCASNSTNGIRFSFFSLFGGTRPLCSLFPPLFTLAIEPLSIFLRFSSIFSEISRLGTELLLYADDVLLYVSDPVLFISSILSAFQRFDSFSGFRGNITKSKCYHISDSIYPNPIISVLQHHSSHILLTLTLTLDT